MFVCLFICYGILNVSQEALDLVKLAQGLEMDENGIYGLALVCKETRRYDLAVPLRSNWYGVENTEIAARELFFAYVRTMNYEKQVTFANALFKKYGRVEYYFWSILGQYMQVVGVEDLGADAEAAAKAKKRCLMMAGMMVDKALKDKKITHPQMAELYLQVVKEQGRLSVILDAVAAKGPLAPTMRLDGERAKAEAEVRASLGHHAAAAGIYMSLLTDVNPDDWFYWLGLFDSLFAIGADPASNIAPKEGTPELAQHHTPLEPLPNSVLDAVKQGKAFIAVVEALPAAAKKRGPAIAKFELALRALAASKTSSDDEIKGFEQDLLDGLLAYVAAFGTRACAFSDMKKALPVVAARGLGSRFLEVALKQIDADVEAHRGEAASLKDKESSVYLQVTRAQLSYALARPDVTDASAVAAFVARCVADYEYSVALPSEIAEKSLGFGDDLLLVAAALMLDVAEAKGSRDAALEAAALCEWVGERIGFNAQVKLTAFRAYHLLWTGQRPWDLFVTLNLKNLQWETMVWPIVDLLHGTGHEEALKTLSFEVTRLHLNNLKDVPDQMPSNYKVHSYGQVVGFVKLYLKMKQSINRYNATVDGLAGGLLRASVDQASQILTSPDIGLLTWDPKVLEALRDNADYDARTAWDLKSIDKDALRAQELNRYVVRASLMQVVRASLQSTVEERTWLGQAEKDAEEHDLLETGVRYSGDDAAAVAAGALEEALKGADAVTAAALNLSKACVSLFKPMRALCDGMIIDASAEPAADTAAALSSAVEAFSSAGAALVSGIGSATYVQGPAISKAFNFNINMAALMIRGWSRSLPSTKKAQAVGLGKTLSETLAKLCQVLHTLSEAVKAWNVPAVDGTTLSSVSGSAELDRVLRTKVADWVSQGQAAALAQVRDLAAHLVKGLPKLAVSQ